MCLTIRKEENAKKKLVVNEPLVVWKVLVFDGPTTVRAEQMGENFAGEAAFRRGFAYYYGVTYTAELGFKPYHVDIFTDSGVENRFEVAEVESGLHAFTKREDALRMYRFVQDRDYTPVLVRCEVPVGAEYYEGEWRHWLISSWVPSIAASKLVVVEKEE